MVKRLMNPPGVSRGERLDKTRRFARDKSNRHGRAVVIWQIGDHFTTRFVGEDLSTFFDIVHFDDTPTPIKIGVIQEKIK